MHVLYKVNFKVGKHISANMTRRRPGCRTPTAVGATGPGAEMKKRGKSSNEVDAWWGALGVANLLLGGAEPAGWPSGGLAG